jgi:hypothetical protein
VQYRLSEVDGGTLIKFRHSALGVHTQEQVGNMNKGWTSMNQRVRTFAEAGK